MARKGNEGTKVPTTYKPFHIPPEIRALKEYGRAIAAEQHREYVKYRDAWKAKKKVS